MSQREKTQIVEKTFLKSLSMFNTLQLESMTLCSTQKICDSMMFGLTKMDFLLSETAPRRSKIQICYTSYSKRRKGCVIPTIGIFQTKLMVLLTWLQTQKQKTIVLPARKKVTTRPKTKTNVKLPKKKEKRLEVEQSEEDTEDETSPAEPWEFF